jgi:ABC-2 type transport system permease protein
MSRYTGTLALSGAALRRDRVLLGVWALALTAVVYASAAATAGLYPSPSDRVAAARAIDASDPIVVLYGPILDVGSLGELAMTKLTVLYAVGVALLVLVLVRRHTRGEEEEGHAELLGATAVGRSALPAAAVLEGTAAAALVGVLAAGADVAAGLPVTGSLAFGASWTGVGLVSAGLTVLACQLSASSRTCATLAGGALGVLYALRAVGDVRAGWLSWASPFGWSTRLRAWHEPRWWVLLLDLGLALLLAGVAGVLHDRRDLGSGVLSARPGPREGNPRLADVFALTWRVQRAALVAWSVSMVGLGAVLGAVAPGVGDLLDSDAGRRMLRSIGGAGALEDALLSAVLAIAAVVVTGFGIAVVGHVSSDERDGRTEQVLATATSRSRSFLAGVTLAVAGIAWLLALTGVATGMGLGRDVGPLLLAGLAQAPAAWAVLGVAVLLAAVRSRWAALGWAVLALVFVVGQLGGLLDLPGWVTGLSPYAHSPAMPAEDFAPAPAVVLTGIGAALLGTAWWRYARRDIG